MNRRIFFALAAIPTLAGCWIVIGESFSGYTVAPADASVESGSDAGSDAVGDGARDSAMMGNCTPACTGANVVCDPADNKCKPERVNVGAPCVVTSLDADTCDIPQDHKCFAGSEGFNNGYCTLTPCSRTALCPIGATCAQFRGEYDQPACYKICSLETDCRMADDYGCVELDGSTLYVSGAGTKVCHPNTFQCSANTDCPLAKPTCDGGPPSFCN